MTNILFTVVILGIVLGVLVLVHELGHYWAAKAFGVWVHRFAIGIGKPIRALSFTRGETEYAVAWLPLGGYVKMASREEDPSSSVLEGGSSANVPADRVFEAKPIWQRMVIILAGVTLNIVFAWLIFTGLALKNGRRYDPTTTVGRVDTVQLPPEAAALASLPVGARITAVDGQQVHSWDDITERLTVGDTDGIQIAFADRPEITLDIKRDALAQRGRLAVSIEPLQPAVIGALSVNYPARQAGMEIGDSIVAVDGEPIRQWSDATQRIRASAGKELRIDVARAGNVQTITVTPRAERDVTGDSASTMVGRIGATAKTYYLHESLSFTGAVAAGADATWSSAGTIFQTIRGFFNGQVSTREVGGPILIGQMAAEQARAGIENLLAFIALISVNLAVVNLLPIPVLDGGAFLMLVVEGIIRRPLPIRLREAVSLVGLAMVVLLMVIAFKNDISRLISP